MALQQFHGKTPSDVDQEFLRWLQNNQVLNVKKYPMRRAPVELHPMDLAHTPLEISKGYSMLVEYEYEAPSLNIVCEQQ
jgi:hypothetical protein